MAEPVTTEKIGDHGVSSSDLNPCPICLGPVQQESYLDQCFHKFCYNCILHWSKVVAGRHHQPPPSVKCPLCKRVGGGGPTFGARPFPGKISANAENKSLIHGYNGSYFQKYYFNEDIRDSAFFTEAHKYRLQCYYIQPGTLADKFDASLYWKSNKFSQPNHWLFDWLRREIQALTLEEDVDIITHHILGIIDSLRRSEKKVPRDSPERNRQEFKALVSQSARPFLTGRTDRFVEEVELFLASGLNIEAYDKVYIQHLGWKVHDIPIEDDTDGDFELAPVIPSLYLLDDDCD